MKFEALRQRVLRAELVVAVRVEKTRSNASTLGTVWRAGWTPLRIITVGLAGGFLAGKLEPKGLGKKVQGARWLQMIGSVSSLLASSQAAFASAMAAHAASTADEAAETADAVVEQADPAAAEPRATARAPAPAAVPAQPAADPLGPRPAEAATELSER